MLTSTCGVNVCETYHIQYCKYKLLVELSLFERHELEQTFHGNLPKNS